MKIWYNGDCRPHDSIQLGLLEQGLHYGTGVFEGIRAYSTPRGPAIFRLPEHMARLERGAETLNMTIDRPAMEAAMPALLHANGLENAYIRPLAFYGGGPLHLDTHGLETRQAVAVLPWKSHLGEDKEERGVRMIISSMRKNSSRSIPALKLCGGYVNAIIAKLEATRRGFDEALFLDDNDNCVEATAENLFMIKDGRVISCEHPDALPGITRDTICALTGAERRTVSIQELLDADEIFLTGTSAEVAPVTQIDERRYGIGPLTRQLQATYQDIVHGRDMSFEHWLTYAEPSAIAAK